ncbi:MAG: hypothetical protein CMD26_06425 [Flavobacteriales bacterium]|nr:hypothetical protein [Flavobacteriales bacterium]|tara:strand:+ start:3293 stop:3643 length:351 start_codon:yes stop_codon:yes gene_type:complete
MKKSILFTFLLTLVYTFSFASFPVLENAKTNTVVKSEISFPVSDLGENDKTSFIDSVKESFKSDVEWGSFLVGFLLGLLGVLLVWIFDGDTSSAWKGFGAWLILILALNFLVYAAV